jgi:hypothetical protein
VKFSVKFRCGGTFAFALASNPGVQPQCVGLCAAGVRYPPNEPSKNIISPQHPSKRGDHMADRLTELKAKYQSVLNFIQQQQNTQLQNVNMEGDKLFIRASAPSLDVKNKIWDQIKLVDPTFSDLTAEIQAPEAAAAAAAGGGSAAVAAAPRTYVVKPGDSLTKISQEMYGHASQYMKIFEANKDKLPDPDKVKAGMELIIP